MFCCLPAYTKRVGKPVQTHLQCTCAHSHTDTHTYAYTLGALVFQDFSYSFSFILPFASTQFTQHGIISWWCQSSSIFAFLVRSAMIDVSFCEMPCLLNHHCEILTTSSWPNICKINCFVNPSVKKYSRFLQTYYILFLTITHCHCLSVCLVTHRPLGCSLSCTANVALRTCSI